MNQAGVSGACLCGIVVISVHPQLPRLLWQLFAQQSRPQLQVLTSFMLLQR